MTEHNRNSGADKIRRLVDSQQQAIANRSKLVDAYMAQLESFFEATKEGSNLFHGFFNGILKLLPTNWAKFIKTFLLVAGIIVAVPIVFAVANNLSVPIIAVVVLRFGAFPNCWFYARNPFSWFWCGSRCGKPLSSDQAWRSIAL